MDNPGHNGKVPKDKTVKVGDYTVALKFNGLSDVQKNLEKLLKWHLENNKN